MGLSRYGHFVGVYLAMGKGRNLMDASRPSYFIAAMAKSGRR